MSKCRLGTALTIVGYFLMTTASSYEASYPMAGHLDNTDSKIKTSLEEAFDLDAEESSLAIGTVSSDNEDGPRYTNLFPSFAFNGGKPFSLEKDPITGEIDFAKAPPLKALNYTGTYNEEKSLDEKFKKIDKQVDATPNEINPYSLKFHDFLNLPVQYSSGKDKYPLISNSYANTKIQSGSNSYNTYNHKPYHGDSQNSPNLYYPTKKPKPASTEILPKASSPSSPDTTDTTMTTTTTTTKTTTTTTATSTAASTTTSTTTTEKPLTDASSSTTKEPLVTTWKPASTIRIVVDDYDHVLPIEKIQNTFYQNDQEEPNNVMVHLRPSSANNEYYNDGYEEDYELGAEFEDDYSSSTVKSTTATSSTMASTTINGPDDVGRTSPRTQNLSQEPLQVTSMPLDVDPNPSVHDNTVIDNQRPIVSDNNNNNHFVSTILNQPPPINNLISAGGNGFIVESTSNIVVPPGQDTVSFVLGNRQNVQGGFYSPGTAVGVNPYGNLDASFHPMNERPETIAMPSVGIVESTLNFDSKKPLSWANDETEISTIKIADRNQGQTNEKESDRLGGYVVFPSSDRLETNSDRIVIVDGDLHESSPTTIKTVEIVDDGLPKLPESLTPPIEQTRPQSQYYYQYLHPRPQQRPIRVGKPPSPVEALASTKRRPYSDVKLPNILPQFRPNAKSSHGHRGPESIGTLSASPPSRIRPTTTSHQRPPSRRPLLSVPPHLQRLNPPPPPIHALRLIASPSPRIETVVPPNNGNNNSPMKRFHPRPMSIASKLNPAEEKRLQDVDSESIYSEEPLQSPPRPPLFPKHRRSDSMKTVTTLQMIQLGQTKEQQESSNENNNATVVDREESSDIVDRKDNVSSEPVYVVYPVDKAVDIQSDDTEDKDDGVVVGTHGFYRPLPPDTLLQNQQEDPTREKIVKSSMPVMGPPYNNNNNNKPAVVTSDFPYKLETPQDNMFSGTRHETPLLVPSDQENEHADKDDSNDTSVNVIPYLQVFSNKKNSKDDESGSSAISVTLHRYPTTSTPIAYVYTPTDHRRRVSPEYLEGEPLQLEDVTRDEISRRQDLLEKPILLPSQQASSSSNSAPSPQNFMAPFVASLNAEEAPSQNGWSVVSSYPANNSTMDHNKNVTSNQMNNEDEESNEDTIPLATTATPSTPFMDKNHEFDPDNFKPQLFGGFKPIYEFPAAMKNSGGEVSSGPREASTIDDELVVS